MNVVNRLEPSGPFVGPTQPGRTRAVGDASLPTPPPHPPVVDDAPGLSGGNYSRLEHSLGVMEIATRIFNVITDPTNVGDEARAALPELSDQELCRYWRRVVRVAALCHDLGHLPFSTPPRRPCSRQVGSTSSLPGPSSWTTSWGA